MSVKIPLFDESSDGGAEEYIFQPDTLSVSPLFAYCATPHPVQQAKWDIPLIEKMVLGVKSRFDSNGQPPHRQPSARDKAYNPASSAIFVVDCEMFLTMKTAEIQEIHRHRHILVTGVKSTSKQICFGVDGLQMLADVDSPVDIQCKLIILPPS